MNDGIRSKFAVLILIILEYYIRVEYAMKVSCIAKGLNPYYTGILYTSQTESTSVIRKYVLILIILEYYIREQNYQRTIIHSLLTLKPKIFLYFHKK